jgi:hypothetical protein
MMNKVSIFILVILMLGLVLFSFLGNSSIEGFATSGGDEDFMKYKSNDEEVISFGMGEKGDLTVIQTDKSGKMVKYTGKELTDQRVKSYVEGVTGKNKKIFTATNEGPGKGKATAFLINYNGINYLVAGPPIGLYLKLTPDESSKMASNNWDSVVSDSDKFTYKNEDGEVISFTIGEKNMIDLTKTDKNGNTIKYTGGIPITDQKLITNISVVSDKKTFSGTDNKELKAILVNYNGDNYLSYGMGFYQKLTPKTTFSNSESGKSSNRGTANYDPNDLNREYHKGFLGRSFSEKEDDDNMWDSWSGDSDFPSSWARLIKKYGDSSKKEMEKDEERADRGRYRDSRYDDDYDNYNHFNKKSTPSIFYGPNGTTAKVMNTYGKYVVIVSDKYGKTTSYHPKSRQSTSRDNYRDDRDEGMNGKDEITVYRSQGGGKAEIYTSPRSQEKIIKVTDISGNIIIYSSTTSQTYDTSIINKPDANVPAYSESKSNTASKTSASNVTASNATASKTTPNSPSGSGYDYKGSLPSGISKSMIPKGDEDLYILKSEVVPPVCPACPPQIMTCPKNDSSSSSSTKCPPCPPCARCPEPAFSCQKVPNYSTGTGNPYLPVPVLSSFSTFGM